MVGVFAGGRGLEPAAPGTRVSWLELFYDLVFVFAFLTVALSATASALTPAALVRDFLILALLWFAWTTFAAVGNAVRADQGIMPLVGFASVLVIFVATVSIPHAFSGQARGRSGDFVFAGCYLALRALQVGAIGYAARHHPHLRPRWPALVISPAISSILLLAAAFLPGLFDHYQFVIRAVLWGVAIAVAYGVTAAVGNRSLPIVSPRHWADRYAQVILIALGESLISLGTGRGLATGLPLTWSVVTSAVLGVMTIIILAWAYFDMRVIVGEHAMHRAHADARISLARDAYTYLHLPMILGITSFSLGLKRALTTIADPALPLVHPLPAIAVNLLYGGVFTYATALLGFQLRIEQWTDWFQAAGRVLVLVLIPAAWSLPGIAALALLVTALLGMAVVNQFRLRGKRATLRTWALSEERAIEAAETWWRHGEEEPPSRAEIRRRARPHMRP